jgi:hypothetical protein
MAWTSRIGWLAMAAWAAGSTWQLMAQHSQLEEQAQQVEELRQALASLRVARVGPGQAEAAPQVETGAAAPGPAGAAAPPELSEPQLEALAARVASLLGQQPPGTGAGEGAALPQQPSRAEQQQAARRANALLDEVLTQGRLSSRDIEALRRELAPIEGTPEAEALRKRIAVALNQGHLVPDDPRELLP